MALPTKKFTRFFRNKKTSSSEVRRIGSRTKGSKSINIDEEFGNEAEKPSRNHVNKIKWFEYEKSGHITTNCFSKQKYTDKHTMKVKVTISNSINSDDEDDNNFLAIMASSTIVDPLIVISKVQEVIAKD